MYLTPVRRSGHNGWIEVVSLDSGQYSAVTNGSILIVPAGTVAYVSLNGILSRPYSPGRYEIFTSVDPFFVRLRNALMRGDPATTFSVFFVSVNKTKFFKLGTGEIPFKENRFNITMKALASCNLSISIADPLKVLSKMVGTYSDSFSEDDVDPCVEQTILSPVRDTIATALSKLTITEFNSNLSKISESAYALLKLRLREYGFNLEMFDITSINILDSEMSRLKKMEDKYADGEIKIALEKEETETVYGGIKNRTMVDIATGTRTGGPAVSPQFTTPQGGGMNGMMPAMMQWMMFQQMAPSIRDTFSQTTQHTDMFGNARADSQGSTSSADAPPPVPSRTKRCPSCNGNVIRRSDICPICGYRF